MAITVAVCGVAGAAWVVASRSTPTSFTRAQVAAFKDFFPLCAAGVTPEGSSTAPVGTWQPDGRGARG